MTYTHLSNVEMTNLYLYGQDETPEDLATDAILRNSDVETTIDVDVNYYMDTGAGRFSTGATSTLVDMFFNATSLPTNISYTKQQMATLLGIGNAYATNITQWQVGDSTDDYAERVYIYNSTAFEVTDSARFTVDSDGTRHITNFALLPRTDVQENFDFESADGLAGLINPLLEYLVDPSFIGRGVNIDFSGTRTVDSDYTDLDFSGDEAKLASWTIYTVPNVVKLAPVPGQLNFDGATNFTHDGKAILYGSPQDDNISTWDVEDHLYMGADANTGGILYFLGRGDDVVTPGWAGLAAEFVVDGGDDNDFADFRTVPQTLHGGVIVELVDVELAKGSAYDDTFTVLESKSNVDGQAGADSILGGEDNDILLGGAGNDTLNGGQGSDLLFENDASNRLEGAGDPDKLTVEAGGNTLNGGQGDDLFDISALAQSANELTIVVGTGDGHDYLKDAPGETKLKIEATSHADFTLVVKQAGRVLVSQSGSPDIGDEDPMRWGYKVDVFVKMGSDTVYVGKGLWHEWGYEGDLDGTELAYIENDVTVVTQAGSVDLDDWLGSEGHQDQVRQNAFSATFERGADAFDEAVGGNSAGNDSQSGGTDGDELRGGGGADSLAGGAGNDQILGGTGDDQLAGGDGADTIEGGAGDDVLAFDDEENDYSLTLQADGSVLVEHIASSEVDTLIGVEAVKFQGGAATALRTLLPNLGSESIDTLEASGSTLIVALDGTDTITLTGLGNTVEGGDGTDTVWLDGDAEDFTFVRHADGAVEVTGLSGSVATLIGVERLAFDGEEEGSEIENYVGGYGTPGDDYVSGTPGDDHLWGLEGDDALEGSEGNDTIDGGDGVDEAYFFGGDEGDFTINMVGSVTTVSGPDGVDELTNVEIIRFADDTALLPGAANGVVGTSSAELLTGTDTADIITPGGGDDTIQAGEGWDYVVLPGTVEDYEFTRRPDGAFVATSSLNSDEIVLGDVEALWFGDGHKIALLADLGPGYGTPGDDFLNGTEEDDHLVGFAGDDSFFGVGGNDMIDGGDGLDTALFSGSLEEFTVNTLLSGDIEVIGPDGEDTLSGVEIISFWDKVLVPGAATGIAGTSGADSLAGTVGRDIFAPAGGADTLNGVGGEDLLVLSGTREDHEILWNLDGSFDIEALPSGPLIQVRNVAQVYFQTNQVIQQLADLAGERGTNDADYLTTAETSERLFALGGDDDVDAQVGGDTIDGGAGVDFVRYATALGDYTVTNNLDGSITLDDGADADVLKNAEIIYFEGDQRALLPGAGSGVLGTSGADTLTGGAGRDILSPAAGNDVIDGAGGEDVLALTGVAGDYSFDRLANGDIEMTSGGGTETDLFKNIEIVWFAGDQHLAHLGDLVAGYGTAAGDQVWGTYGDDHIYGLGGDDDLIGLSGNDTVEGGAGVDLFDALSSEINWTFGSNPDGSVSMTSSSEEITLRDVEIVLFSTESRAKILSGTTVISGTGDDDSLSGTAGRNILDGGEGEDSIDGGGGDDILLLEGDVGDYEFEELEDDWISAYNTVSEETELFRDVELLHFPGTGTLVESWSVL